ncbi:MAG: hypothetical protein K2H63_00300 [Paramuribaculum sp.]|nr:hypothetical protein [Paramuribaculum sp.]
MCKILPRLKEIADNEGITIGALERSIGASKGVISRAINNGTDIQSKWLQAVVEKYPHYSTQWLLSGEGDMVINNKKASEASYSNSNSGIPLIPVEAMAGYLSGEVSVLDSDCDRLNIPGLKADFVIPVSGDSMEPNYHSGDYVACQNVTINDIFFQWGKVYVIDTNQGVLLKKVKKASDPANILLVSENPDYDPITMPRENVYHIALVKGLVRII